MEVVVAIAVVDMDRDGNCISRTMIVTNKSRYSKIRFLTCIKVETRKTRTGRAEVEKRARDAQAVVARQTFLHIAQLYKARSR